MTRRIGPKGQVVIPKEIRDTLGLSEGTPVRFSLVGEAVEVRREPTPEQVLEKFFTVKGRKVRKRVDWRSILDEEFRTPSRK